MRRWSASLNGPTRIRLCDPACHFLMPTTDCVAPILDANDFHASILDADNFEVGQRIDHVLENFHRQIPRKAKIHHRKPRRERRERIGNGVAPAMRALGRNWKRQPAQPAPTTGQIPFDGSNAQADCDLHDAEKLERPMISQDAEFGLVNRISSDIEFVDERARGEQPVEEGSKVVDAPRELDGSERRRVEKDFLGPRCKHQALEAERSADGIFDMLKGAGMSRASPNPLRAAMDTFDLEPKEAKLGDAAHELHPLLQVQSDELRARVEDGSKGLEPAAGRRAESEVDLERVQARAPQGAERLAVVPRQRQLELPHKGTELQSAVHGIEELRRVASRRPDHVWAHPQRLRRRVEPGLADEHVLLEVPPALIARPAARVHEDPLQKFGHRGPGNGMAVRGDGNSGGKERIGASGARAVPFGHPFSLHGSRRIFEKGWDEPDSRPLYHSPVFAASLRGHTSDGLREGLGTVPDGPLPDRFSHRIGVQVPSRPEGGNVQSINEKRRVGVAGQMSDVRHPLMNRGNHPEPLHQTHVSDPRPRAISDSRFLPAPQPLLDVEVEGR
ncbi:hypothetical protein BDK51DRAFT_44152 [Blyttiomyces helicus]|uniref:Uncharacterized protein n=1 Tax=Blyttiomyces helicus TaxID=388810 RepID=A0A4V1IRH3_9FUNG|nr:hypothetical protein BDK51DRAFT_44152 [Blyttiomyces helicus]|eukprot:RKO90057.1 hypothetical protein BDK51DRAFT_44152 [Blyttiomyces helicus]